MLTCTLNRFLASTGAHTASAAPWPESASHNLDARSSVPIHTADVPLNGLAELTAIPFRAQSAVSAHHKQLSIPILLPR